MIAALCLDWLLAQQFLAAGEDPVKLIVKVVAIRQDRPGSGLPSPGAWMIFPA